MSKTVTYKCDRCGGESQSATYLQNISVNTRWRGGEYESTVISAEWCEGCLSEMKIEKKKWPPPKDYVPAVPSLEDLVRNIVREEMGGSQQ